MIRQTRGSAGGGFSLVEVVMALGIIAFAVVAIFGLMPVGYRAGSESRQETRAAYLAEQLLGDLRASLFTNAVIYYGSDPFSLKSLRLDLQQAGVYYLSADATNRLIGPLAGQDEYEKAVKNAAYLAQISVKPDVVFPNLSRIEVEVSTPAEAPWAARQRFVMVTQIGAR